MELLLGVLIALVSVALLLDRVWDARNITRLRQHYRCTDGQAARLYWAARRNGFGAAHDAIFGGQRVRRRLLGAQTPHQLL